MLNSMFSQRSGDAEEKKLACKDQESISFINVESDKELYRDQIDACRHCDGEPSAHGLSTPPARCLLCERYFIKGRLFLNNVG
jgi:hypothetical protein